MTTFSHARQQATLLCMIILKGDNTLQLTLKHKRTLPSSGSGGIGVDANTEAYTQEWKEYRSVKLRLA